MNAHTCTVIFTHSEMYKTINRYITIYKSHSLVQNRRANNAFDWLTLSRAAPALHTFDLESFWIDTGLSRTIKNVKFSFRKQ